MLGWDIGGVNTKVARVRDGQVVGVRSQPFEMQRDPTALVALLRGLAAAVGAGRQTPMDACAVTMTAELSQMFRRKREGVCFVLDAVEAAFPSASVGVYGVDGRFLSPGQARIQPLTVAAANWAAAARAVAAAHPNAVLIDVGTTTTDIIPIVDGRVAADGWTDPDRLLSGELVYTGALRTPVEAIVAQVPYRDGAAGVSAEHFALIGDVYVWRGELEPEDYTVPTPDGRPVTRDFCGERLARVICADRDLLDDAALTQVAAAVAGAQVVRIAAAVRRVAARHSRLTTAVVAGLGAFIAGAAARSAGLDVVSLASTFGAAAARCAPAAAVALLLEEERLHV